MTSRLHGSCSSIVVKIHRESNKIGPFFGIFFSNNIERLVQNYRSSFLQIAIDLIEDPSKFSLVNNILTQMDNYFPGDVIPTTDAELDIQIGRIYMQAGKPEELKNRLEAVQKRKDVSLETQMYIGQVLMSDFQDYDAAIEHYKNLLEEYPYIPDFVCFYLIACAQ